MNSMTGFGHGEASLGGLRISIDLSSVNRKQTEFSLSLPRELDPLESRIRDRLTQRITRGRVNLRLSVDYPANQAGSHVTLNLQLARQYLREIERLAKELKLTFSVSLESLLRVPGVFELHSPLEDPELVWSVTSRALDKALKAMLGMRATEGAALARDLKLRIRSIKKSAAAIAVLAPASVRRYRESLSARLAAAGLQVPLDDERLIKEIVLFADRSDISEELTRLRSHLDQFDDCTVAKEPIGRKLDFLVQEMNREINTIGSKASDAAIAGHVIEMKAELERFREQAQNVE